MPNPAQNPGSSTGPHKPTSPGNTSSRFLRSKSRRLQNTAKNKHGQVCAAWYCPRPSSDSNTPTMTLPPGGKRGLCWPNENKQDKPFVFSKPGSRITWLYNWSPNPTPGCSLPFVPMQWNHVNADALASHAQSCQASAVLGFNEPELAEQANMPVDLAAREWLRCIEPLRRSGIRCGSPGISSAPQGVVWLREFLVAIRAGGGDVDFYALHWYGETLGQFYDHLWSIYYQLGPDRPVWVTEFAATNWSVENPLPKDHVENFCRESCKYLDTLEWVERYAWFGAMRDPGTVGKWAAMFDEAGKLTELGRVYRDGENC